MDNIEIIQFSTLILISHESHDLSEDKTSLFPHEASIRQILYGKNCITYHILA